MESYKIINEELLKRYGKDINNRPMYRLVQNYNLTEKRFELVEVYGVEVRNQIPVEVPKYTYIEDGFWILEKLFNTNNPDIAANFSYEPLWVFKTKEGLYQAPVLRACILIIESALRGPVAAISEEEQRRKEVEHFKEVLGGKAGIGEKIGSQEGVSFSGLDAPSQMKGQ